jgi:hypothetical protein
MTATCISSRCSSLWVVPPLLPTGMVAVFQIRSLGSPIFINGPTPFLRRCPWRRTSDIISSRVHIATCLGLTPLPFSDPLAAISNTCFLSRIFYLRCSAPSFSRIAHSFLRFTTVRWIRVKPCSTLFLIFPLLVSPPGEVPYRATVHKSPRRSRLWTRQSSANP